MCSNDSTIPRSQSDTVGLVGMVLVLLAALVVAVCNRLGIDL